MSGINPTARAVLPNATSDEPSQYKANLDAAINALARPGFAFAPSAQDTPNMTVRVEAGALLTGTTRTEVAAQSTGTITPPSAHPRIDLVYIDKTTGAVGVVTGTEASIPAEPALPNGKLPVALVHLTVGMTAITNGTKTLMVIEDIRVGGGAGVTIGSIASPSATEVASTQDVATALAAIPDAMASVFGLMWYTWRNVSKAAGTTPQGYLWPMTSDLWTISGASFDAATKGYLNGGYYGSNIATAAQAISDSAYYPMAGAFNGTTSDANSSSDLWLSNLQGTNAVGAAYLGQAFSARTVGKVRFYLSSVGGSATPPTSCKVQYSTNNGSTWQDAGTFSTAQGWNTAIFTPISGVTNIRVTPATAPSSWFGISELEVYPWTPVTDATLTSPGLTATNVPAKAKVRIWSKPTDTITPDTDVKAWASRDGGTTWVQAPLTLSWAGVDGVSNQLGGVADFSSAPSGTSVKVKITTHNTKAQAVTGAGIEL